VLLGYIAVLLHGGWCFNDLIGMGSPLQVVYVPATTVALLGIVACRVGTAITAELLLPVPPFTCQCLSGSSTQPACRHFQFGGSTHCLVFRPGALADVSLGALPQPDNLEAPLVLVRSKLATAT
jgi:hypothetical protein